MIKEDLTVSVKVIDARLMQKAFLAGAKGLEAKKEWINELNVFPVPDGDTGTNMTMTIMSAARNAFCIRRASITFTLTVRSSLIDNSYTFYINVDLINLHAGEFFYFVFYTCDQVV